MTTVETLKRARDRIAKGWIQGQDYREEPEGWCAAGALDRHIGPSPTACGACAAEDLLREAIGSPVTAWNDEPGRTKEEVLAVFDKAIQLAAADASRDAAGIRHD